MLSSAGLLALLHLGAPQAGATLEPNRSFEVLPANASHREALYRAGILLGPWSIDLAGTVVNGARLTELASASPNEPIARLVTETFERPVDLEDLLYFLDDLLHHEARLRALKRPLMLTPFRARSAGVFVHPSDVFEDEPRRYGEHGVIELDVIPPSKTRTPAADGSPLGPDWSARFEQPETEEARMAALAKSNPDFARRASLLVEQLRRAGATVEVESTVRSAERGLLIYGAFRLSKASGARDLERTIRHLERDAARWGLSVPIRWRHPKGTAATLREAKRMAEAFNVVFASRRGARRSKHYEGRAIDISAFNLPRSLTLVAPGGPRQSFDLSDPKESRDLSLTPALVEWIEAHFGFEKLRSDYPHWNDAPDETVVSSTED